MCPTRGRPENAKRLLESIKDTHRGPVGVHFYCDSDDPRLGEYDVPHHTGPDYMFAMKCHILAKSCDGHILMMCGDDAVFQTKGWDSALRSLHLKWPDGIWCASCWDGTTGKPLERIPKMINGVEEMVAKPGTRYKITHPHPAIARDAFEALGYLTNPIFRHFCCDPWLTEMFMDLGRFAYFKEVRIDHLRAGQVKGVELDETWKTLRPDGGNPTSERDRTVYGMFRRYRELDKDILRLKIKEYDTER